MTKAVDTRKWLGRFLVFVCILLLPFIRFLLQNHYGLFHFEVGVAVALIGSFCLLFAVAARPRPVFLLLVFGLILVMSENTLSILLPGQLRARWILLGVACVLVPAFLLLKERFFQVLLIFFAGAFAVDLIQGFTTKNYSGSAVSAATPAKAKDLPNIIHIVFDEHVGLAGFPDDIPECRQARDHLQAILLKHGFQVFPEAFSNYRNTKLSIPSIVNSELIGENNKQFYEPEQFYGPDRKTLRRNHLFSLFQSKGYGLHVYESDYINYCPPNLKCTSMEYKSNSIGDIAPLPIRWTQKLRHIATSYIQSDAFLEGILVREFPSLDKTENVGPLCVSHIWPNGIAHDIETADRKTFFFAHLLTPHYPYVYLRDGSLRRHSEWNRHGLISSDAAQHRQQYEQYAEQVENLSTQLDRFLSDLERSGSYNASLIVLHGDHGSRLRLLDPDDARKSSVLEAEGKGDQYDYSTVPPRQDLLNRFSTLFAAKLPGSTQGSVIHRKASVMRLAAEVLDPGAAAHMPPSVDEAYLFDQQGKPKAIPIISIWDGEK